MAGFTEYEAWLSNSTLFSGSKIYLMAKSITYTQDSMMSYSPIINVNPGVETGESTIGDLTNYTRRKGKNSYSGINNISINITGVINRYSLGSFNSYNAITPGALYTMFANGHKTFRFYDGKIGSSWVNDPISGVQKPYNSTTGIPVVLLNYSISAGESDNILNYNLTLREEKE